MRYIIIGLILLLTSACISNQYTHTLPDGTTTKYTNVGNTGFLTRGASLTVIEVCPTSGECLSTVRESDNPTMAEQLFTGAAMVGSAALIGDGLKKSGTNVNANGGGSSAFAGAASVSRSSSSSRARGGGGW